MDEAPITESQTNASKVSSNKLSQPNASQAKSPVESPESQSYVSQWVRLISTTNWDKGRIILEWRDALIGSDRPAGEYSDEIWSQLVGSVTGQHVGRLRRVYQRFASVYQRYDRLFWSHFQASVDWDDAEMWLEGASQSKWSVSQMRKHRWETMGSLAPDEPKEEDVIASEKDEDFEPANDSPPDSAARNSSGSGDIAGAGPRYDGPDFGDADAKEFSPSDNAPMPETASASDGSTVALVQPFGSLPTLPDDVADAFESFKLALLRHKAEGWKELSRDELFGILDALKELALAPSAEDSPAVETDSETDSETASESPSEHPADEASGSQGSDEAAPFQGV